jgi:hypothetical protein
MTEQTVKIANVLRLHRDQIDTQCFTLLVRDMAEICRAHDAGFDIVRFEEMSRLERMEASAIG